MAPRQRLQRPLERRRIDIGAELDQDAGAVSRSAGELVTGPDPLLRERRREDEPVADQRLQVVPAVTTALTVTGGLRNGIGSVPLLYAPTNGAATRRRGVGVGRQTSGRQSPTHANGGDVTVELGSAASLLSQRTAHFELPPQWDSMRKALRLERQTGRRVIHLEKGDYQGDEFRAPSHVIEACAQALRDGHTRYVPGPGLPELREAIAAEASRRGRRTEPDEVLVTMGAKHALTQTLLTVVDPADEVIFPDPGYPPDEFWTHYAGGVVRHVPMREPEYQFDLDALERMIGPRTKLLIINTPQRPNGQLVEHLDEIASICAQSGVAVLSDEIFGRIVYPPARHESITAREELASLGIMVDTFSKSYVMTGFRIGWVVAPPELTRTMDIFQQNSVTNVPAFVQLAALAALTGPQEPVEQLVERLQRKRDFCVDALNAMPCVACERPPGSFYVFADVAATGLTAQELADHLLERHGVGVVAGTAFGPRGEGHIRITYAAPDDVIEEGMARLRVAFEELAAR